MWTVGTKTRQGYKQKPPQMKILQVCHQPPPPRPDSEAMASLFQARKSLSDASLRYRTYWWFSSHRPTEL